MRNVAAALAFLVVVGCAPGSSPPPPSALPPPPPPSAPEVKPDRAARVAAALVPVVRLKGAPDDRYRIEERMARFHVPGVSIAVVDEAAVVWARGFGTVERGKDVPITPTT